MASVTVSCPGKVLLAGGYLVLEAPNVGLTIATSARFHTSIDCVGKVGDDGNGHSNTLIEVDSVQFKEAYTFQYDQTSDELSQVSTLTNNFVKKCLMMTLRFIRSHDCERFAKKLDDINSLQRCIRIQLRADNDFYSQIKRLERAGKPLLSCSLRELEPFAECIMEAGGDVPKTGLGSSAALVTSLVGALLAFFDVPEVCRGDGRWMIHNLAQLVHSHAQGKIGSGFDVSSAVFGSQVYRRFDQSVFTGCLETNVPARLLHDAVTNRALWTQVVEPFNLPPGIDLVLGDVCGGSSSSSMARAVLEYRKAQPAEANALWNELSVVNVQIVEALRAVAAVHDNEENQYIQAITWCSNSAFDSWTNIEQAQIGLALIAVRESFQRARLLLRNLGEGAGVEIEPKAQQELLDATLELPGVLAAGVPGAGGHDAAFVLVLSAQARERVELLWSTWGRRNDVDGSTLRPFVCPLILSSAPESGISIDTQM